MKAGLKKRCSNKKTEAGLQLLLDTEDWISLSEITGRVDFVGYNDSESKPG